MTEAQRDEVLELLKSNSTQHTQKLDTIINLIQNLDFGIEGGGTIPTPPVPDTDFIVDDRENKLYTRIFEKSIEWTVLHTGVYEVFLSGGGGAGGGAYSTKGGDSKFSRNNNDGSETLLITAAGGKVGGYQIYYYNTWYSYVLRDRDEFTSQNNTINTNALNEYAAIVEYNYPTTTGYHNGSAFDHFISLENIHQDVPDEDKQKIMAMITTGYGSTPGGVGFGQAYTNMGSYDSNKDHTLLYWYEVIGKNVNSSKLPQGITRNGLSIKPGLQGFSWTTGLNFTNMNGMKYGSGGGCAKNATRTLTNSAYATATSGGQGGGFVGVRLSLKQGEKYIIRIGAGGYTPQDNNDCAGRGAQGVCMINLLDSREDL